MRWARRTLAIGTALCALTSVGALTPAVAFASKATVAALTPTPPMGWSAWYRFYCGANEALIERTAKTIASNGMEALGYRYVDIDDCWMSPKRDASGALVPDPKKYPDGISGVAAYVHRLGLKLGIYLDAGSATCTGFPGSAGHFAQDAASIASWGVDYVKVDYCRARPAPAKPIYTRIQQALLATHRPIVLGICDWGYQQPWIWGPEIASTWRTSGDYFGYGAPRNFWRALLKVVDLDAGLASYSAPGAFNDPNNMLIGTRFLTASEERAQLSLWSILAAPLIAGGDLATMSAQTRSTLTNRDVIAVDQDPAGLQGTRTVNRRGYQVWARNLADGSEAVLVMNTGNVAGVFHVDVSQMGLPTAPAYLIHDLWQRRSWHTPGPMDIHVWPHDVRMLRVGTSN